MIPRNSRAFLTAVAVSCTVALTLFGQAGDPSTWPYTWRNVKIVAGGFITGITMHPAESGLMYARTDIGGAYRWDKTRRQWIPLTDWVGPNESNLLGIEAIGIDPTNPDRLYLALGTYTQSWAGTGAIARSADRGATFQRASLPIKLGGNEDGRFAGERLVVDPLDPSRLFFGSRNDGLWTSTDSAATWNKVSSFPINGPTNGIGIVSIVFDPVTEPGKETVYAVVSSSTTGLYRSNDKGATWEPVPSQPSGLLPNRAVLSPEGTMYLAYGNAPGPNNMTAGAVWKYIPATGAWTNITPNISGGSISWGFGAVAVDAANPQTVLVTTMDRWGPIDDIYRSRDAGATWKSTSARSQLDISLSPWLTFGGSAAKFGWWMGALAIDPFDSNHVLYGTGATIYATNDLTNLDSGGIVHWKVGADGLEETAVLQLVSPPAGPHLLSGLGDIGGFAHDDLSVSPPSGMYTNPVFGNTTGIDFAESKPSFVVRVGTANGRHGAYSTDGGHTWKPFGSDAPGASNGPGAIAVSADGNTLVWSPTSGTLSYSVDSGATWSASKGAPSRMAVSSDRINPSKFYVYDSSTGAVYISTDGGVNFTLGARNLSRDSAAVRALPGKEGELWLPLSNGLYRSTDSGATFARVPSVGRAVAVGFGKAASDSGYPALYLSGTVNNVFGIFRSVDAGASWTRINDDTHQYGWIAVISGDPRVFGRVYLGTNGRGVIQGDIVSPSAAAPKITAVVNGASFTPAIQTGSWITIRGENLAPTSRTWEGAVVNGNLPVALEDVHVFIAGKAATVYYISANQINALAPLDDVTGPTPVIVETAAGRSDAFLADIQTVAPALFVFDPQDRKYAAAVTSDGSYLGPEGLFGAALSTRPAKPGDVVEFFGTGCGPTDPPVPSTRVFTGAAQATKAVSMTIGGAAASLQFAGMTGAGLCQFNAVVPNLPDADQQVTVTVDGVSSPDGVYLAVKH